jgi:GTP cyclohydrolase I
MKDIQSQEDHRRINIKKVGVKDISYPITVLDKARKVQRTVARVNMYVNLPHLFKGTHMSRFLILEEMKEKLDAQAAHMEIEFPYFMKKETGQMSAIGTGEYVCRMHGSLDQEDKLVLEVRVPIVPPLPSQSSEGMPRSPGHWGNAIIRMQCSHFVWMEDLIQMVEEVIGHQRQNGSSAGSGSFFSVEAITRALGEKIAGHPDITRFSVTVENLAEGYSTFASLQWPEGEGVVRDN